MRELLEVLVTVKAAPVVGRKTGEAICVAGIRLNGPAPEWVRLFPIHFRDRAFTQRFKKYQIIGIEADRGSDTRPESWRPNEDTIDLGDVLGTRDGWQARREIVEPLMRIDVRPAASRPNAQWTPEIVDVSFTTATLSLFEDGNLSDSIVVPVG